MSVIYAEEARREVHSASRSLHREMQPVRRKPGNGIDSVGMLHVHALAIAQEAIARYREFAAHVADHGNNELADIFSRLFELKTEHAFQLAKGTPRKGSPKPASGEYAWLHSGPLPPEARDFIFRMLTPRQALEIAVSAEERAKAFFEQVRAASNDAGARELAIELGRVEDSHIAWLQDALARVPEPFRPSEECPGDPATPQAL